MKELCCKAKHHLFKINIILAQNGLLMNKVNQSNCCSNRTLPVLYYILYYSTSIIFQIQTQISMPTWTTHYSHSSMGYRAGKF